MREGSQNKSNSEPIRECEIVSNSEYWTKCKFHVRFLVIVFRYRWITNKISVNDKYYEGLQCLVHRTKTLLVALSLLYELTKVKTPMGW